MHLSTFQLPVLYVQGQISKASLGMNAFCKSADDKIARSFDPGTDNMIWNRFFSFGIFEALRKG